MSSYHGTVAAGVRFTSILLLMMLAAARDRCAEAAEDLLFFKNLSAATKPLIRRLIT